MQCFLFYVPENEAVYRTEQLAAVLEQQAGFAWDGDWQRDYRSGVWTDPHTHALCLIDVGNPVFDQRDDENVRHYDGWQLCPLQIKVSLSSPHWHCVESARFIEGLLQQLPHCAVLDTEDTGDDVDAAAPGPLDRMRVLASWEQLHTAQTESRQDIWRMSRVHSIALWRYRRVLGERQLNWPQALVLLDKDTARSAVVWEEPEQEIIVPPVELAVLKTDYNTSVMSVEELISRASHVKNLDSGGAVSIPVDDDFQGVVAQCVKMDLSRFKFLTDSEWSD